MIRIYLIAGILVLWYVWWRWRRAPDDAAKRALLNQLLIYGLLAVIFILALTGRIHWLGAAIAAALPLLKILVVWGLRFFPTLAKIYSKRAPASNAASGGSKVETAYLEMVLNHQSGKLGGRVIAGRYEGQELDALDETQLRELLSQYQQQDAESARLLVSYLQRRFQDFAHEQHQEYSQSHSGSGSDMSLSEAREILDVPDTATRADIRHAHRKLMQKLHPDHGGTDYFAAKLNQARDLLTESLKE